MTWACMCFITSSPRWLGLTETGSSHTRHTYLTTCVIFSFALISAWALNSPLQPWLFLNVILLVIYWWFMVIWLLQGLDHFSPDLSLKKKKPTKVSLHLQRKKEACFNSKNHLTAVKLTAANALLSVVLKHTVSCPWCWNRALCAVNALNWSAA